MNVFGVLFGFLACLAICAVNGDIGPGVWRVLYIKAIEDDSYMVQLNVSQHKYNRTHEVFDGHINCKESIDDTFGIRIDICMQLDGGCKPYQVLTDDSVVKFINKYAENNLKDCLTLANVDPPELPLPVGQYIIESYMFDYSELPPRSPYGTYFAKTCLLQGTTEVSCIESAVEFYEQDLASDEER